MQSREANLPNMTPLTKGKNRLIPKLAKIETINCFLGRMEPENMLIVSEGASPESTFLSFLSGSSSSSLSSALPLFLFELFSSENLPERSNLKVSVSVDSPMVEPFAVVPSFDVDVVAASISWLSSKGVEGSDLSWRTRRMASSFSASLA